MTKDIQKNNFWSLTLDEVGKMLSTNLETGLTANEALNRLSVFGPNEMKTDKKTGWIKIILNQLKSPLILVLIAAAAVTILISHYRDAAFILFSVVVNSILGFWQENKAERALAEIKTYLKQRARVIRDGQEKEIVAGELVPGDVIRLAQGDRVPADARVIFVNDFQIDEAVLTGESLPVSKNNDAVSKNSGIADQSSMVFAGTLVTQGVCAAVVCRTDAHTELGKIAAMVAGTHDEKTPLQKSIIKFSVILSIVVCLLTTVVFAIGLLSGQPPLDMFLTSVAIAVSAIPEGLPVSMTVILAIGVERMAKRKGLVRKLIAAEALGGATIILTDKTGTITQAKMELSKIVPFGCSEEKLLLRAIVNTNVLVENPGDEPKEWRMNGRIMETALVRSAAMRGIAFEKLVAKKHVLQSVPFNSVKKYSVSLVKTSAGGHRLIIFGAPDVLVSHSSLDAGGKKDLHATINELTGAGERVLGVASKDIDMTKDFSLAKDFHPSHFSFDGLIAFRDPVRPGVKNAVALVSRAGVKTVILTGDHQGTAVSVAREIGLDVSGPAALDASEMALLTDDELRRRLPSVSVISRVTPFDKMRIAKLYQSIGEVVAMTGDGVNDAPSIKQADIGIAMGSGTEVAQSVADLVLLDDNFESIVAAIDEGRQILGNIKKVLVYFLSNITNELILIGGSILIGLPLPLSALQILWVNFFSDSFPAVAFAFEKDGDGLKRKPYAKQAPLFDPLMKFLVIVIGLSTSILLFVLYVVLLRFGYNETLVKTFIFAAFGTYTLFAAFALRSLHKSILKHPIHSNSYMTTGVGIGLALMVAAVYVPPLQSLFGTVSLPIPWALGVVLLGVVNIVLIEIAKKIFNRENKI